jgi:hypothetical protein
MTAVYTSKIAKDGAGNSFNAAVQDQDGTGASIAGVHTLRNTAGADVNPATSDLQTAANASLASIATNTAAGSAITGASMPSGGGGVIGWLSAIWTSLSGTLSVSAAALPLPTGAAQEAGGNLATIAANSATAATAAAQATGNASLSAISAATGTQADTAYVSGSGGVIALLKGIFGKVSGTLSVSASSLPLPTGAALEGGGNLATIATKISGTLPISASALPLPAGAAQEAGGNLAAIATTTGGVADTAYVSGSGSLIAILKGIFGKLAGTLAVSGTFWPTTQPVSAASLPLPTGAALEAGGNLAAISAAAGTQADVAYSGSGSGSTISLLKWIGAAIKGTLSVSWAGLTVADGQSATGIAAVGKMLFNGTTYDRQRSGVLIGSALVQPIDGSTGTGSVSSAAVLFSLDTAGYAGVSVIATAMPASNVVTFEGSNDNTNWTSVLAQSTGNSGYPPTASAMVIGVPAWFIPAVTRYIRARVSTYASGTISVAYALRSSANTLAVIGAQTGGGAMSTRASGIYYGGLTKARIQSLATTNSTLVKTSAGQPYVIDVGNNGAADAWFKLYDKATAPTVGTDTPVASIYVPKGTARTINFTDIGVAFSNGIGYGITGAAIDTDTTAVAVNQVTGMIAYT